MKRRNVKDNVENQINGSTRASTPTINKKIIGVGVDALIDPLKNRAITLIALIITMVLHYYYCIKYSNNNGFLEAMI